MEKITHNKITSLQFREMLCSFLNVKSLDTYPKLEFNQLHQKINDFIKSKSSWGIILKLLLQDQQKEILYFSSNMLKDKLKFDFQQLESNQLEILHNSLIKIISKHIKADKTIQYNLSLSVVYIYMHAFQQIGDLLIYLENSFSESISYIYIILMFLAEEIKSTKIVIQYEKQHKLLEEMKNRYQKQVLESLDNSAKKYWESKQVKKSVFLKCFGNWILLNNKITYTNQLQNHFLLHASLQFIFDKQIEEQCVECLCIIIQMIQTPSQQKSLILFLAERIFYFFEIIKKLIQQEVDYQCQPYLQVLMKLGYTFIQQFINQPNQTSFSFFKNLLDVTAKIQMDCCEQIVQFWIYFLKQLDSEHQNKKNAYKPFLKQFFIVCCRFIQYLQYELIELNKMSKSQLEQQLAEFEIKQTYRFRFNQIFKLTTRIIGQNICLQLLLDNIKQILDVQNIIWTQLQCLLYPLQFFIEQSNGYISLLSQITLKLVQLQIPYVQVKGTIITFLSYVSLKFKTNNLITYKIFSFIVEALSDYRITNCASKAFEHICGNNILFVIENIESFIQLFQKFKNNRSIVLGIINAIIQYPQILFKYLPTICDAYLEDLIKFQDLENIKNSLNILSSIISKINNVVMNTCFQVVKEIFRKAWNIIKNILIRIGISNNVIVEKICKFIKQSMRCLKYQFGQFIEEVFSTIIYLYQIYPISSYVYLAEILITVFNQNYQYLSTINQIYEKICDLTFSHLSKLENIQSNPELVEDFFGMNIRFMRYCPMIVLNSQQLNKLLILCNLACGVQHIQIAKAVYSFIQCLFQIYWSEKKLNQFQNKDYANLLKIHKSKLDSQFLLNIKNKILSLEIIQKMIKHLQKVPSISVRKFILDALKTQIQTWDSNNLNIWMSVLASLGEDILTKIEKSKFINLLQYQSAENLGYLQDMLHLIESRCLHRALRSTPN